MTWPKTGVRDWAAALPRSSATSATRPRWSSARAARARRRSSSSRPIRATRAAIFPTTELDELADVDQGARHHPADRGARDQGHERSVRDHRRRAALARGAARRPARGADRPGRGDATPRPRAGDHRERAARRSQSAGRGDGLSVADRPVQAQPERRRQVRRQEPQPRRQHAAAAAAAGVGEGLSSTPASSPPATRARWSVSRTPTSWRATSSTAGSTCARSKR